jgi:indolepyruvate ferredoxin oxidoreductase
MKLIVEMAELPLKTRGFGPVKAANARTTAARRAEIIKALHGGGAATVKAAE